MNKNLLLPKVQEYINANLHVDLHSLLLKKSPFEEVTIAEIANQIKGKKVAQTKFPFLLKEGVIFPPQLNLEQASSEATSLFKSKLYKGKKFIDLTSGFGIDAFHFSKNFDDVTLVERNLDLLEIVAHNWGVLDRKANFIHSTLEDFLAHNKESFDMIYLDPARRDEQLNKVFLLEQLSPNILEIEEQLLKFSNNILIKLSPLIDISYIISALKNVSKIYIVAIKNDVKELLVELSTNVSERVVEISAINLETEEPIFSYKVGEGSTGDINYSKALDYLYIPNNAILKTGAFNEVAHQYHLFKLHPNTHLYTSNEWIEDFPGRKLKVEACNAKHITKKSKFNVISKNYPMTPDEIKKKYKIIDGGNEYLIFTQSIEGKIILKSS